MNSKILLPSVLFTALLAASQMAVAQEASTGANATAEAAAQATAPDAQLAERYAQVAGSTEAAAEVVERLHDTGAKGSAMAYGEIDTAMALSGALVESGSAANFDSAVDTVTGLRAEGMGWGQVAQELDVDLGAAVNTAHRVNGAVNGAANVVSGAVDGAASGAANARTAVQRRAADARVDAGVDIGVGARGASQQRPAGAEAGVGIDVGVGASGRVDRPQRPARPERGGLLGGGLL